MCVTGKEAGLLQGELQGAVSCLQMMVRHICNAFVSVFSANAGSCERLIDDHSQVRVVAPFGWNVLFDASMRAGAAGRIYLCMAAVHISKLAVTAAISAAADDTRSSSAS